MEQKPKHMLMFKSMSCGIIGCVLAIAQLAALNMFWIPGEFSFFQCYGAYVLIGACFFVYFCLIMPKDGRVLELGWWKALISFAVIANVCWLLAIIYTIEEIKLRKKSAEETQAILGLDI